TPVKKQASTGVTSSARMGMAGPPGARIGVRFSTCLIRRWRQGKLQFQDICKPDRCRILEPPLSGCWAGTIFRLAIAGKNGSGAIRNSVLEHFEQRAPASVMARVALEHALPSDWINAVFEEHRQRQYSRELLFSTVIELVTLVSLG